MLYGNLPEVKLDGGEMVAGVLCKVLNPPKTAVLRLPTAAEMLERLEKQRSIRRSIGRRKSQTEFVPNTEADLALFKKVRLDKGEDFDEFEAANALGKLTYCEVTECARNGSGYLVTVKTPFGETVHHLGIPTQKDITFYRRSVVSSTDLPHGQEELRYRIEPAVSLYDSIVTGIDGYAPEYKTADVPPHHKSAAVVELVQAIDELDAPSTDPNF